MNAEQRVTELTGPRRGSATHNTWTAGVIR